jgi:hypothetical protein
MREDRQRRLIRKAQKIRERLGGLAKLLEPFPQKPTQMHQKTSWRLRQAGLNASVPLLAIGLLARARLINRQQVLTRPALGCEILFPDLSSVRATFRGRPMRT